MAILYARKLFLQKGVEKLDKYNKVNSFKILHFTFSYCSTEQNGKKNSTCGILGCGHYC